MLRKEKEMIRKLSGKRLKEIRREEGLSQEKFADLFSRNQQDIQRYETGRVQLPIELAKLITERFPTYRADWLLGIYDIKRGEAGRDESQERGVNDECIKPFF